MGTGSEGSSIRLTSLFTAISVAVLVLGALALGIPWVVSGRPPEGAYLFTDPVALPAIAFALVTTLLVPAIIPRRPRSEAGAPPSRRPLVLRAVGAVAVLLGCVVLRAAVIRDAAPTQEALDLMRRHATAKAIGAPVEVGWDVRGWIYAGGSVNDEHVPPSIDATIPVSGPRGAGVLTIEGHVTAGRWTFQRVSLQPDRGGARIDVISASAPAGPRALATCCSPSSAAPSCSPR
ncbi:Hypothetical protein A7982_01211 [Minicystis rosea]|nr:Hypothetical protein A7982_01211 [Minicystis rosea]